MEKNHMFSFLYLFLYFLSLFFSLSIAAEWPSQLPFWPHYPSRDIQVLDGEWEFGYISNYTGVTSTTIDTNAISTTNRTIVPSAFDYVPPGYEGPRGTAFYRTYFTAVPNQPALILFAACGFYCNIYVDNVHIGDHRAAGYSPFWLSVPPSPNSNRTLFVVADNRFNFTTAPMYSGTEDFYCFGGLMRNVIVHTSPAFSSLFIQRLEVSTVDYMTGLVNISVVLSTTGTVKVALKVTWDNNSTFTIYDTAYDGIYRITSQKVQNAKLWGLGEPNLHVVTVALLSESGETTDSIQTRFGIRYLSIDSESRITLNGNRVKFHGIGRHTMVPYTGPSLTVADLQTDLQYLLDLNVNFVRGVHYPQDQRFLDLCDENGIAVWEEALGYDVTAADIESPYFMSYQFQQINEMISASFNHPSILIFGYFNEGNTTDPEICPGYKANADLIHERTSNQITTWADNRGLASKCLKYAEMISFNYYPGWYTENGNYSYPTYFWPWIMGEAAKQYDQPLFSSESGCEGIYEWINTTNVPWGQMYQVPVITNDIDALLGLTRVSGMSLNFFADFKVNDHAQEECGPCNYYPGTHNATYINVECDGKCGDACRPCGENHKGILDFWRRTKLVYPVMQKLYNQQWP